MPEAKPPRGKTKAVKTRPAATMPADPPVGGRNADTLAEGIGRTKEPANEPDERANATTAEASALMKQICSAAAGGAQAYNAKVVEFARANTVSALDFARQLSIVSSPLEFMKLSSEYNRRQLAVLTTQTKELAAIAEKVTHQTAFKSASPPATGADSP
jgi:hypothetical protein